MRSRLRELPGRRRVDFEKREVRREQLTHHFLSFDDEEPERFAILFLPERTKTLKLGLGQHTRMIGRLIPQWQATPCLLRPG